MNILNYSTFKKNIKFVIIIITLLLGHLFIAFYIREEAHLLDENKAFYRQNLQIVTELNPLLQKDCSILSTKNQKRKDLEFSLASRGIAVKFEETLVSTIEEIGFYELKISFEHLKNSHLSSVFIGYIFKNTQKSSCYGII